MKRIMFVCHGNICRSPMAELIMKDLLQKEKRDGEFQIASSATSSEEIIGGVGNPIYPPAQRVLLSHGIEPTDRRAVQIKKSDYDKWDHFVCMDGRNMSALIRLFNTDPEKKVKKLLSFCGEERDVSDPWYSGDFEGAYTDICKGCRAMLEQL